MKVDFEHLAVTSRSASMGASSVRPAFIWSPSFYAKSWQMSGSLLPRIAAGDRDAVEECIARYGGLIWSLAIRYLSNRSDAEESVQEIFFDLWRHAGRFDERVASERTFVMVIARRRLIDLRRKWERTITTTSIPVDIDRPTANSDDQVSIGEEAGWVREQLTQLRPIEQKVIQLAVDEGLSHSQIAELLNIPLGTVKSSARRGLIHLRDLLRKKRELK